MRENYEKHQFQFIVDVFHGPSFGHRIEITTQTAGRMKRTSSGGYWKGLGIPEGVLNALRATMDAMITEHLVTRYGVQGELPIKWAGEPDPF